MVVIVIVTILGIMNVIIEGEDRGYRLLFSTGDSRGSIVICFNFLD